MSAPAEYEFPQAQRPATLEQLARHHEELYETVMHREDHFNELLDEHKHISLEQATFRYEWRQVFKELVTRDASTLTFCAGPPAHQHPMDIPRCTQEMHRKYRNTPARFKPYNLEKQFNNLELTPADNRDEAWYMKQMDLQIELLDFRQFHRPDSNKGFRYQQRRARLFEARMDLFYRQELQEECIQLRQAFENGVIGFKLKEEEERVEEQMQADLEDELEDEAARR